ncbi:DUF7269 family protein [Halomarina rubra]|uniref:Uncharacterized protein n=1 Tax=Halomarina rubra TaxID=2071873 RepID=A0ABD6AQ53_9EURY|nr:hypothetical protein [Halomarina rubra]
MTLARRLATGVGFLAVLGGLTVAAVPSLAPALPSVTALTAAVGLGALLVGGHAAYGRSRAAGSTHHELAATPTSTPPPEAALAVYLDDVTGVPGPVDEQARAAAYLDVRRLTVAALVRSEGCSPAAARRRLTTGEWTDDTVAAAFFTGASPSLRDRLREWVTGEPTFERRGTRAVAAVTRIDAAPEPAP